VAPIGRLEARVARTEPYAALPSSVPRPQDSSRDHDFETAPSRSATRTRGHFTNLRGADVASRAAHSRPPPEPVSSTLLLAPRSRKINSSVRRPGTREKSRASLVFFSSISFEGYLLPFRAVPGTASSRHARRRRVALIPSPPRRVHIVAATSRSYRRAHTSCRSYPVRVRSDPVSSRTHVPELRPPLCEP
jgi:hypothetical protein